MLALLVGSASFSPIPTVTISPGVELPMAGLGTWQYNSSRAEAAVALALSLGYTHIDTALGYGNQDGVGRALRASGRSRDSYFVTSKIPGGLSEKDAASNLTLSVMQLGLDYVDLMLVHFPATWGGTGGKAMRQAEWRAMEAFVRAGKARAIGVSHYCKKHLQDIFEIATIRPAVNQVQYHVGMGPLSVGAGDNATDDKGFNDASSVLYQSFSPLCGPCDGADATELITGDLVTSIGSKYGKTGAQVALRWQVQLGIPVIPKTDNAQHLAQNIDLFSWSLDEDDMTALSSAASPPVAGDIGPSGLPVSGDCDVL